MSRLPDIHHRTIILDIDGTLTSAGQDGLDEQVRADVARLKSDNALYLLSNKRVPTRNQKIARELGVPLIVTNYRKPDPRALRGVVVGGPLTVVGDKVLTDGLLAYFAHAEFICVPRLVSLSESVLDRFFNVVDDLARHLYGHLKVLRIQQWVKNLLVFAPLFFAGEVSNLVEVRQTLLAFIVFCLLASAGYIVNDYFDADHDRLHEHKRRRPLASGDVPVLSALTLAGAIIALAAIVAASIPMVIPVACAYLVSSIAYSVWLKFIPVAEMLVFVWFYLARMLGGGLAAGVPVTAWLTLSVTFVALFLVVAKRYAQYTRGTLRPALRGYSLAFLQAMLCMTSGLVIVFYAVYTVLGTHSSIAVYSVLPAVAGITRLLYLSFIHGGVEYPERILVADPGVLMSGLAWVAVMSIAVYTVVV